jgi:hypothetical protein
LAEKLWREQNERWPLETAFARPQPGQAPLGSQRTGQGWRQLFPV